MMVNPVVRCPICSKGMHRVPQAAGVHFKGGFSWDSDNNGKGKWISGLGKASDPKAYCKSLGEAEEKAKKRNLSYDKA